MDQFQRTELLIGREGLDKLKKARVAVFGLGGVGGPAAEALARSGVGAIDLIDNDQVSLTNLNRQIIALHSTLGRPKAEVTAERLRDIHPDIHATAREMFYLPETRNAIDFSAYDYIADAIDTVTAKLDLIEQAFAHHVPIVSAMGAGNRMDPTQLRVGDVFDTRNCPLARIMRRELRRRGIPSLKVVYSLETALHPAGPAAEGPESAAPRRDTPGSMAFVPPVMGMIIASVIVRDLLAKESPIQPAK